MGDLVFLNDCVGFLYYQNAFQEVFVNFVEQYKWKSLFDNFNTALTIIGYQIIMYDFSSIIFTLNQNSILFI